MATTVTVNSNYAGKDAGEYVGKAFKEADTLQRNLVTVLPDIDFQISLKKIAYSDGRQNYACGFTPQGTVVLSEKLLTPKKIKNELQICKEDLRQIWSSASMGFSAHNDNMPKDVETALLNEILMDEAEAVDANIWTGDASNAGEFDGFITLFDADANVIKAGNGITSLGSAITEANVTAEIKKFLQAIPVALRKKSDLVVGISTDIAFFWNSVLVTAGVTNGLGADGKTLKFGAYNFEVINGLPANTFVAYQKKNLNFGTGLLADHNEIRIKDMDESDLSGQVRFKMVYTAGVQYYNSNEIVWYLTTTTP